MWNYNKEAWKVMQTLGHAKKHKFNKKCKLWDTPTPSSTFVLSWFNGTHVSSYTLKVANSNEVLYKVKTKYQLLRFLCGNPLPDTDKMKWLNLILLINHDHIWYKKYEVKISWAMMTKFQVIPFCMLNLSSKQNLLVTKDQEATTSILGKSKLRCRQRW